MSAVPPAAPSSSSSSAPVAGPTSSTPTNPATPSTSSSVSRSSTQVSGSSTSTATNAPSSSSASSSHPVTHTTIVVVQEPPNGGPHRDNSVTIIAPIAAVACTLVIAYICYRLFLLHRRHKNQKETPLPPPRTPAIMEQRRPVSFYGQPPTTPNSPNIRPLSMVYGAGQSNLSFSTDYTNTKSVHSSGHSTPVARSIDDSGRFTPLPASPRQTIANRPRPHSVASYTSARHSVYSMGPPGSPLRGPPHTRGTDAVLPQPLNQSSRQSRYSMYSGTSYSELRRSIIAPSTSTHVESPRSLSRSEDWADRLAKVEDAQSSSTCTAHQDSSKQGTGAQDASSPASRTRSLSPPEQLLSSDAFAYSTSGSTESVPPPATRNK